MPPKKPADPPPQSDESASDFEEETVRKQQKRAKQAPAPKKGRNQKEKTSNVADEELNKAADQIFDGSDGEDDDSDLFAMRIPPKPDFLVKANKRDRLMIMNVEVENFKSYFGKASIGPFHKSFTSIIGPNGSGKSNLIDSLLFVFGFRANKIRSTKVANLIHKSACRNPESCTVTIHFQRIIDVPGHYEIVKDSAFEISRTAFKNSSSSYAIDGRAASKSEVEARLRMVNIDIEHNRFLILQGEVEQIAMMKPVKQTKNETGMVEYLEDIVGSNRLEPFVKRFQRRVKRLHCEQTQQRIVRDHARNSKIAMEPQVRASIEFLVKENEATTIQMKLDQRRRQKYLEKVAPRQTELDKKNENLKLINEKIELNKNDNKSLEEEENNLLKDSSKIDKQIDQLKKEMCDMETEEKRRKETMKRHEADISKTEADIEKEEKKKENFIAVPEKAEKKIKKLKEEHEQLLETEKAANKKTEENITDFEKEKEQFDADLKKAQETCSKCTREHDSAKAEATIAQEGLTDMKEKATSEKKKLDDMREQLKSLDEKLHTDNEELEKEKSKLETLQTRISELDSILPAVENDYKTLNIKVSAAQEQLDSMRQQNNNNASGESKLFKRLREEKEAGRIPSYIGRLGDLAVIDPKYEATVCTNFWHSLSMLVVGTSDDGAKMINIAQNEKLGRIHTLCLDRIRPCRPDDLVPPPSGRFPGPRLFDLIECEPEFKHAMFDQFRNTIVADSMQDAIKWNRNFRSDRIVTIQGAMVNPNGSITAGGKPMRGGIFTDKNKQPKKVSQEDLAAQKKLEEDLEKMKQDSNKMRQKRNAIAAEQSDKRSALLACQRSFKSLSTSVDLTRSTITGLKDAIVVQEREAKKVIVDAKEIEEKQKIVEELQKKQKELFVNAEESRKRQTEIQSKVDEIYQDLIGRHKNEAKEAQLKRQKIEKEMAKEEASVTTSSRNIKKCDENIERLGKDIEKKRRLCEELQEKAVDEQALTAKKTSLDELAKKKTEITAQQDEVNKKLLESVETDGKLVVEQKNAEGEIEELRNCLAADKQKVKEIDRKLDGLQINRIPQFQFLAESNKPEDLQAEVCETLSDENETPEKNENNKKQIVSAMSDKAYALEYGRRREVLKTSETYGNIDGDKLPIELLTPEQVAQITARDVEQLQYDLKKCEEQLAISKPKVDLTIIAAYVAKVDQYNTQNDKLTEVSKNHGRHNERLQQIKRERLEEFHSAFEFIGKHLVAVYKMLTDGGDAKLEYIDKDDPFKEGISFMVRPAKKAWKAIQFLSGGEKTLSSLALIFALHMFRPTPFYVMDEIDAALDYRNVSIIAQYVRQKTENAQFIIISLRNNMFELANRLVGIYKVDGCTKNVAIDPEKVCEMAKSISDSLGVITCTLPGEVTQRFNETMSQNRQKITANEKQYPNFPSTNDISKAEKIVSVEGRVRKQVGPTDRNTPGPSRAQSNVTNHNTTNRPASTRPESRGNHLKVPNVRLVDRVSTVSSRTPRKERNTEPDETTPPVKRPASAASQSAALTGELSRKEHGTDAEEGDSE